MRESGRTLCFIRNFNIYRSYPRPNKYMYVYIRPFLPRAAAVAVTGFAHARAFKYKATPATSSSVLLRLTETPPAAHAVGSLSRN